MGPEVEENGARPACFFPVGFFFSRQLQNHGFWFVLKEKSTADAKILNLNVILRRKMYDFDRFFEQNVETFTSGAQNTGLHR